LPNPIKARQHPAGTATTFLLSQLNDFLRRRDLVILLAVALVLRIGFLLLVLSNLKPAELLSNSPDTRIYVNTARGLLGMGPSGSDAIFIFGVGYAAFLTPLFFIFGLTAIPILLVQIILSSIGCLLLYELGRELTGSKEVGLLAGYLAATSITSISLAAFVLSDCLFFFLLLLSCLLFLRGMNSGGRGYFIGSGLIIGVAVLVRAIGQFWPLVMIILAGILPTPAVSNRSLRGSMAFRRNALLAPLIACVIIGGWVMRNYALEGVATLSFASAGGPANIACTALADTFHREPGEIMGSWFDDFRQRAGLGSGDLSFADNYRGRSLFSSIVVRRYPGPVWRVYRGLVWENLTIPNELFVAQLPQYRWPVRASEKWYIDHHLNTLAVWLTLAGLAALLICRKWQAFIFLGLTYAYFAAMIGFTRWQGSRLFYPGQIAWSVIIAFLIVMVIQGAVRLIRQLFRGQTLQAVIRK
jgi:hypothetical protein